MDFKDSLMGKSEHSDVGTHCPYFSQSYLELFFSFQFGSRTTTKEIQ